MLDTFFGHEYFDWSKYGFNRWRKRWVEESQMESPEEVPESYSGVKIEHEISFLSKIFNLKFEFTWRGR